MTDQGSIIRAARADRLEALDKFAAAEAKIRKMRIALQGTLALIEIAEKRRNPDWDGKATPTSSLGIIRKVLDETK